jgi:hypothetical protein
MGKKQTAIQWLIENSTDRFHNKKSMDELIEKALQKEREQIQEAFRDGQALHALGDETRAPQYYKRVYKSSTDATD